MTALVCCGCGDGGRPAPEAAGPQVTLGHPVAAGETPEPATLRPWSAAPLAPPRYDAPYSDWSQADFGPNPTSGPRIRRLPAPYDEPTELVLATPGAAASEEGAPSGEPNGFAESDPSDGDWEDAWVGWPNDEAAGAPVFASEAPTPTDPPEPVVGAADPPAVAAEAVKAPLFPAPGGPVTAPPPTAPDDDELLAETPAASELNRLMRPAVQEAFALGRAGSVYAARGKFETVLRRLAASKDAAVGDDRHTRALTAGLTAVDEAAHFLSPDGVAEPGADTAAIARGHLTPVLRERSGPAALPQVAVGLYHRYAASRLAEAVGGEQAGSMALFGLGKAYARLAETGDELLARRRGLAMYRAAILAHEGNHLAANELGVALAEAGHYRAAAESLDRAVTRGGGSTVYRNLAVVQQRLARPHLAAAAARRAEELAAGERLAGAFSRRHGVRWVRPEQFTRSGAPERPAAPVQVATAPPRRQTAPPGITATPRGPWRSAFRRPAPAPTPSPAAAPPLGNRLAPPVKTQTILR